MKMQELKFLNLSYSNYMDHLQKKGYRKEEINIDETSEITERFDLAKGCNGTVLTIRCPSRYKIIIIGKYQLPEYTNIENAHAIAVRFADSNNQEISPDTRIRIIKEKPSMTLISVATMLYKDITSTEFMKNPNIHKTKDVSRFYRFNDGVELNGQDKLNFDIIDPDINVDHENIKLYMGADLWEID